MRLLKIRPRILKTVKQTYFLSVATRLPTPTWPLEAFLTTAPGPSLRSPKNRLPTPVLPTRAPAILPVPLAAPNCGSASPWMAPAILPGAARTATTMTRSARTKTKFTRPVADDDACQARTPCRAGIPCTCLVCGRAAPSGNSFFAKHLTAAHECPYARASLSDSSGADSGPGVVSPDTGADNAAGLDDDADNEAS